MSSLPKVPCGFNKFVINELEMPVTTFRGTRKSGFTDRDSNSVCIGSLGPLVPLADVLVVSGLCGDIDGLVVLAVRRVPLSKPVELLAAKAARRDAGRVGGGLGAGLLKPACTGGQCGQWGSNW